MKIHVWKNEDGLHLSRPPKPSTLEELHFDPDCECRQCGEHVLSISADSCNICPWCESSMNRPKMLRYQELDIIRLLQKQSDENKALQSPPQASTIGNRYTEKDLRDHLTNVGYFGRSAKFLRLELVAIERPGWVQVFEFHVHAKTQDGEWKEHFGVCRTDERGGTFELNLFDGEVEQQTVIGHDTAEMITRNRASRHWSYTRLMLVFALAVAVAVVGGILTSFNEMR